LHCYSQSTDSKDNLFRNTLRNIPRNNVCQPSGYPLAQSSWHMKLTITAGCGGECL
jgi:hypothetical protein